MRRLFLTLCFLLVASIADAATYYVATTGDDVENDCTEAQSQSTPKQTINAVLACMSGGDTLYIGQGTWTGTFTGVPSGSSGNETKIRTSGADVVTFTKDTAWNFYSGGFSYVHFIGNFVWDGTGTGALNSGAIAGADIVFNDGAGSASHILFDGVQIINWGGNGVMIGKGDKHLEFRNCYLSDNGLFLDGSNQAGYHFYQKGNYVTITHCGLYNAGGYSIHQYTDEGQGSNGNNCEYSYNQIIGTGQTPSTNDPAGILVYSLSTSVLIYNNIIANGALGPGIRVQNGSNTQIYNNTVWHNGTTTVYPGIWIQSSATATKVKNNIAWANGSASQILNDAGAGTELTTNLETNPNLVDPPNNFLLASGSAAINAGTSLSSIFTNDYDGVSRPQGGAWDIGALERVAALANYFYHDAETSPIAPSSTSTYQWSDAQSLVSRSQTRVKNGTWALRHQFVDPGTDNQVGKVIKFIDPTVGPPGPPFPNSEAWFSAWYYFDSAGGTVWQDPKNYNIWANHMQWKGDNNINYQTGTPNVHTEVKCVISMRYVNGVRRWMIDGLGFKYTPSGSTTYPIGTFPWNISGEPGKWANTTFVVPLDEWVFLEVYVRMTQQNGAIRVWSGTANEGILHLLYDMTASDFNFLTTFNQDGDHPNLEGTNQYLYWGIGNYQDWGHASGTYNLYTDDARIANGQIGPTLPEFTEEGPPPPPSSLQVSRKPAVGRIQSSARILSSGRVQ